ncbi:PREDICTED: uncharacterized protein LOC104743074 [Camelina sativa]|uniref:Uncharacterized protein LOC104743074 n=1 Tax=Camelina sativa TaxID=90675 RepID=A0ABM1QVZ3_CAMSA|nr:PREDICTED: uncharacterized protein LOC104743074 [Camelina sativa]
MSMESSHVEEKLCSKRQERDHHHLGWISGLLRRRKKRSAQEDERSISEGDSRLMIRHKAKILHLFLSDIMRKLKHAIRKEKPRHDHRRLLETKKSFQKSLSTKDHFFLERMTSISRQRSHHQEHYDNEKHLSEMVGNQSRIVLSLPEDSSPFSSPGRVWDKNSTVLSRSSTSDDFMNSETVAGSLHFLPFFRDTIRYYFYPMILCDSAADDSLTIKEIDSASPIEGDEIVDEMSKVEAHGGKNEGGILEETLSHPSVASSPSQPLFTEYEINPARGEAKIQEENRGMDDKEAVFKYVKEVLDAIDSNWEELYLITELSDQLLCPALISNIPLYPNKLCVDHDLLFDSINEVIFEFCRVPQWVSFVEPRTLALPASSVESIVSEVQEKVYCRLLPMQLPRLLDERVREDMDKPRSWLDTRWEVEWIGFEISELILNELVEEVMVDYLT